MILHIIGASLNRAENSMTPQEFKLNWHIAMVLYYFRCGDKDRQEGKPSRMWFNNSEQRNAYFDGFHWKDKPLQLKAIR